MATPGLCPRHRVGITEPVGDELQFRRVPAGTGDSADLVAAMVAEMRELYDGLDLATLEDAARGLGYRTVRLDTGSRQPHAQAFYEASGYRRVGNFNNNPAAAFHGEKPLD